MDDNRSDAALSSAGRSRTNAKKRIVRALEDLNPRDRVIRDVLHGLYEGRLEPGQRLIEAQLTEDYGISRGPVREALNRLAVMGVVDLTPQRGAHVHNLSLEEAIDSLVVAQGLVGISARLAAERHFPSGLQRLQAAVADIKRFDQTSTTAEYAIARNAFYAALAGLASNIALSRAMAHIHIHLIRVQFRAVLRPVDERRHTDYAEIAQAVAAGKPQQAEKAGRVHINRSIVALEAFRSRKASA